MRSIKFPPPNFGHLVNLKSIQHTNDMEKTLELPARITDTEFDGQSFNGLSLMKTLGKLSFEQVTTTDTYDGYTVWGIALHLMYWKYDLAEKLGSSKLPDQLPYEKKDWPSLPENLSMTEWVKVMDDLREAHAVYMDALAAVDLQRLRESLPAWNCTKEHAILWMTTHDAYHTAQIRNMGLKDLNLE